jgi:replicative superfamily II helicase
MKRESKLDQLGCVIIDEVHLVGDRSRGFILELVCCKTLQEKNIQLVGMSATIPNLGKV